MFTVNDYTVILSHINIIIFFLLFSRVINSFIRYLLAIVPSTRMSLCVECRNVRDVVPVLDLTGRQSSSHRPTQPDVDYHHYHDYHGGTNNAAHSQHYQVTAETVLADYQVWTTTAWGAYCRPTKNFCKQESCAIAKMTARCALYK